MNKKALYVSIVLTLLILNISYIPFIGAITILEPKSLNNIIENPNLEISDDPDFFKKWDCDEF